MAEMNEVEGHGEAEMNRTAGRTSAKGAEVGKAGTSKAAAESGKVGADDADAKVGASGANAPANKAETATSPVTGAQPVLQLRGLHKSFGDTEVLHGIDLTVARGEVVAILGPSGSGKTTLLRCANFLERAEAGELIMDGAHYDLAHATARDAATVRRHTGFVFQSYNLFRNRTVLGNVTEGLVIARHMPKDEARRIAVASLERVGMADRLDAYPAQLSGGQQQRVAIARALATSPDIIFFDEPTSALDPELTVEVLSAMRALAEDGMTMLVVTHEMEFARTVADRVVFMEEGSVVTAAPAQEFFEHPANERVRTFLTTVTSRLVI